MAPLHSRLLAGLAVALAIAGTSPAASASEDDRALSLSAGFGRYVLPDHAPDGVVLGVDYERGFSETLSFRASGGGGVYFGDSRSYSGHLTIGLTYLFDVIKYVPYANLGLGGIVIGGGDVDTDVHGLLELGVGLDVLHSRSFSYGVLVRFESFVESTAFFTAGVRATWRWGFF